MRGRFPNLFNESKNFLTFEFGPLERNEIECVSISSDNVLACVSSGTSEQDNLGLRNYNRVIYQSSVWLTLSDGVAESGERDLPEDLNFLHHLVFLRLI